MTDKEARHMLKKGFSPAAIAMEFGAVGTTEYYNALTKYGGVTNGHCPYCNEPCFGTGDCNCMED